MKQDRQPIEQRPMLELRLLLSKAATRNNLKRSKRFDDITYGVTFSRDLSENIVGLASYGWFSKEAGLLKANWGFWEPEAHEFARQMLIRCDRRAELAFPNVDSVSFRWPLLARDGWDDLLLMNVSGWSEENLFNLLNSSLIRFNQSLDAISNSSDYLDLLLIGNPPWEWRYVNPTLRAAVIAFLAVRLDRDIDLTKMRMPRGQKNIWGVDPCEFFEQCLVSASMYKAAGRMRM